MFAAPVVHVEVVSEEPADGLDIGASSSTVVSVRGGVPLFCALHVGSFFFVSCI